MIVGVSTGGTFTENLAFGDFTHKHHVASQVGLADDLAGEHGLGMIGQVQKTVVTAPGGGGVRKLIYVPPGLESEVGDGFVGDVIGQDADIEDTGFFDDLPGQVAHLTGDSQLCGSGTYLHAGIGNTAVIRGIL